MRAIRTFVLLLVLLLGVLPAAAQEEAVVAYAYIDRLPPLLYLGPSLDARTTENSLTYVNTGPQDVLATRYLMMVGDLYRFRIENGWAQILPDNGRLDPFTGELGEHTYLPVEYLRLLDESDFAPISGWDPAKRLVIVFRDGSPRIAVFDGPTVVMHAPAFLGRGGAADSLTPLGDWRTYLMRASDNMPSFTGVPYVAYFTGDKAFHEYQGWNWSQLTHGGYGSRGCVNLPDRHWFTVSVNGEQISVAQWLYRWFSSVPELDYNEMDPSVENSFLDSIHPGWYDTTASVRVLVLNSIWDLYEYVPPARLDPSSPYTTWDEHVSAYQAVESTWVLPHDSGPEHILRDTLPPQ